MLALVCIHGNSMNAHINVQLKFDFVSLFVYRQKRLFMMKLSWEREEARKKAQNEDILLEHFPFVDQNSIDPQNSKLVFSSFITSHNFYFVNSIPFSLLPPRVHFTFISSL